jgi:hypothetical protein
LTWGIVTLAYFFQNRVRDLHGVYLRGSEKEGEERGEERRGEEVGGRREEEGEGRGGMR